jgi:hypothetical protein
VTSFGVPSPATGAGDALDCGIADDGGGGGQTMVAFGDEYGADVEGGGVEAVGGGTDVP